MLVCPGVQHGPSPLSDTSERFLLFADNAQSYLCTESAYAVSVMSHLGFRNN